MVVYQDSIAETSDHLRPWKGGDDYPTKVVDREEVALLRVKGRSDPRQKQGENFFIGIPRLFAAPSVS